MRVRLLCASLGVVGCAGSAPPPAAPPASPPVVLTATKADCEPARPPPRAAGPNLCLPRGLPKTAAAEDVSYGATCIEHRSAAARWAKKLSRGYQRVASGRVDVSFGCDPLTAQLREIVIESGYGHGGSLQIWRLTRSGDEGTGFDVVGLAHDTWYGSERKDAPLPLIARGSLADKDVLRALESLRVLLTADVREVEPPPTPNAIGLHSMFFSSGNFHSFFRLRDDSRHELAGGYTGYPNSDAQRRYAPIELAMEELAPLLQRFEFERGPVSPELRTWFSAHVVSAWPRLEHDSDAWWVRERLVNLAGKAADTSVVPMIVGQLKRGVEQAAQGPASEAKDREKRYLTDPIEALSSLTGWDPRRATDGSERSLRDAARAAIAECTAGTW